MSLEQPGEPDGSVDIAFLVAQTIESNVLVVIDKLLNRLEVTDLRATDLNVHEFAETAMTQIMQHVQNGRASADDLRGISGRPLYLWSLDPVVELEHQIERVRDTEA